MRRPSASVFVISTRFPFSAVTTSPGRVACPEGMFSTQAATAWITRPGSSCATVAAASSTAIAPFLSIFISSMPSAGLIEIPPVSKQTPLPTMARRRPSGSFARGAPPERTTMHGGFSEPRPTAISMPAPMRSSSRAPMIRARSPTARARSRASSAMPSGGISFAGRFAQRFVRTVPSAMISERRTAAFAAVRSLPVGRRISTLSSGAGNAST